MRLGRGLGSFRCLWCGSFTFRADRLCSGYCHDLEILLAESTESVSNDLLDRARRARVRA